MLQPGETGKYRHKANRELVTVTRFASRQTWEDKESKAVRNPATNKEEKDSYRVSPDDCEVKPSYAPAFLYPVMALDIAYEPEPETAEEAA